MRLRLSAILVARSRKESRSLTCHFGIGTRPFYVCERALRRASVRAIPASLPHLSSNHQRPSWRRGVDGSRTSFRGDRETTSPAIVRASSGDGARGPSPTEVVRSGARKYRFVDRRPCDTAALILTRTPAEASLFLGAGVWVEAPASFREALEERKVSAGDQSASDVLSGWTDPDRVALDRDFPQARLDRLAVLSVSSLESAWKGGRATEPAAALSRTGVAVRRCLWPLRSLVDLKVERRYQIAANQSGPRRVHEGGFRLLAMIQDEQVIAVRGASAG